MLVLGAPTLHTGTYAEITRVATQMHHAYTQMGKGGKKKKEDGERILREKKKKSEGSQFASIAWILRSSSSTTDMVGLLWGTVLQQDMRSLQNWSYMG